MAKKVTLATRVSKELASGSVAELIPPQVEVVAPPTASAPVILPDLTKVETPAEPAVKVIEVGRKTIKSVASATLLAGGTPEAALAAVNAAFPGNKCNVHWCRWLANQLGGTPGKKFTGKAALQTQTINACEDAPYNAEYAY